MVSISRVQFFGAETKYILAKRKLKELPSFDEFLNNVRLRGMSWYFNRDRVEVSDEAYKKIQMLTGPHINTMLKVWLIQHQRDLW